TRRRPATALGASWHSAKRRRLSFAISSGSRSPKTRRVQHHCHRSNRARCKLLRPTATDLPQQIASLRSHLCSRHLSAERLIAHPVLDRRITFGSDVLLHREDSPYFP